jgi:hypothetical protein
VVCNLGEGREVDGVTGFADCKRGVGVVVPRRGVGGRVEAQGNEQRPVHLHKPRKTLSQRRKTSQRYHAKKETDNVKHASRDSRDSKDVEFFLKKVIYGVQRDHCIGRTNKQSCNVNALFAFLLDMHGSARVTMTQ